MKVLSSSCKHDQVGGPPHFDQQFRTLNFTIFHTYHNGDGFLDLHTWLHRLVRIGILDDLQLLNIKSKYETVSTLSQY